MLAKDRHATLTAAPGPPSPPKVRTRTVVEAGRSYELVDNIDAASLDSKSRPLRLVDRLEEAKQVSNFTPLPCLELLTPHFEPLFSTGGRVTWAHFEPGECAPCLGPGSIVGGLQEDRPEGFSMNLRSSRRTLKPQQHAH